MVAFVLHLLVTGALLLVVAKIIDGIDVEGFGAAVIAALVLGVVNAVVRPVAVFLSFPLTLVTFGLFLLVINAAMLWLAAAFVPGVRVRGFGAAFFGSLLLSFFNWMVDRLVF